MNLFELQTTIWCCDESHPESIIMIASTEPSQSLPAERLLVPYVGFQPDLDNSHFSNQLIIYDFNCRKGVLINLSGQRHVLDCVGSDGMNGKHSGLLYFPLSNHWVCVCVEIRWWGGHSHIFAHFAPEFDLKTIENMRKHHDFMCHDDFYMSLEWWWQSGRAVYQTRSWFTKQFEYVNQIQSK